MLYASVSHAKRATGCALVARVADEEVFAGEFIRNLAYIGDVRRPFELLPGIRGAPGKLDSGSWVQTFLSFIQRLVLRVPKNAHAKFS
jgi:hypothetical protein